MPTRPSKRELDSLSKMSLDQLYQHVGYLSWASVRLSQQPIEGRPSTESELGHVPGFKAAMPIRLPSRAQAKRFGKLVYLKLRSPLTKKICQDWDYCNRRKRYQNEVALANALIVFLADKMTVSISALEGLVFILIKTGLDKFCKCVP